MNHSNATDHPYLEAVTLFCDFCPDQHILIRYDSDNSCPKCHAIYGVTVYRSVTITRATEDGEFMDYFEVE